MRYVNQIAILLFALHSGNPIAAQDPPTAVLSGTESICQGDTAELKIDFTGTPPFDITLLRNNTEFTNIHNIQTSNYVLQLQQAGQYTLTHMKDANSTGSVSGTGIINSLPPPEVSISGLASAYSNKSTEWIPITGTPPGGEFSGNGVLYYQDAWVFLPALTYPGINPIVYNYQASPSTCFGYDTVAVRIFEYGAEIVFEGERTKFCLSDSPFKVQGINLINNEGVGSFVISGGNGIADHGDNTATVNPSELVPGLYTITYTSSGGTIVDRTFEIGSTLKADYTWETECYQPGASIDFVNNTLSPFGFITNSSFLWKIFSNNDILSFSSRNMSYNFTEPGNYKVELQVENSYGCRDTVTKVIHLQPVIALSGQNYLEDFEDGGSWYKPDSATAALNSWELGYPVQQGFPPQGFDGPFSGEKCWFTNINTGMVPAEDSWITSPCFNFTGTEKPTLVARIWRSFTDDRDGANLQYSNDNGNNWEQVGDFNDGVNWYNAYYGNSGDQTIGWTSVIDTGWVEIRHELDFLKDETGVQFRFVYNAYGNAIGNKGIAIDDVRIVERNRTVLFEHFTNTADIKSALADSMIRDIVQQSGTNIIDIHYHTAEPGEDPFNADNPLITGARQFYYGITGVPFTIINGGTQTSQRIDYNPGSIDRNRVKIESLYDSDFHIRVHTMIQSDSLYVEALVNAINDVPETELSVRMAVLEPLIEYAGVNGNTGYRNTVRAMLPDAAGTVMFKSWNRNEMIPLRYSWKIQNVNNPEDVRVIVFIQNEVTREIYQAAPDIRGIVTDITSRRADTDQMDISVYPNPARRQVFVKLNPDMNQYIQLELFNYIGTLVYRGHNIPGESIHSISVDALPGGIYLLRVSTAEGILGNWKIIINK
jgi:hypothetical protein